MPGKFVRFAVTWEDEGRCEYDAERPSSLLLTLISLPRKRLSFMTIALPTSEGSANSTYAYPFGWPVNLSHRMVTRLIVPQD